MIATYLARRIGTAFAAILFTAMAAELSSAQPYDPAPPELKIMTWNVEWFFDDLSADNHSQLAKEQSAPSRDYWRARLEATSNVIASEAPDIVALQEIEGSSSLAALRTELKKYRLDYRYAFVDGRDTSTEQNVGFLMKSGLVSYGRREQSSVMYSSRQYYNLSKHLFGEFRWQEPVSPMTILNVHYRATADAEELRTKQAKLSRKWCEAELAAGEDVIILGDTNSEYSAGEMHGDVAAIVGGGSQPRMVDLLTKLDDVSESTHLVLNKQFDRIYVSQSMMEDGPGLDWVFVEVRVVVTPVIRGRRDGPEHWHKRLTMPINELDASDHFPVVAEFELK